MKLDRIQTAEANIGILEERVKELEEFVLSLQSALANPNPIYVQQDPQYVNYNYPVTTSLLTYKKEEL